MSARHPHPVVEALRHRLRPVEDGAGDLHLAQHLAQLLLHVQEARDADGVRQPHGEAAEELQLAQQAGRRLHVEEGVEVRPQRVDDLPAARAAVDHHAVPGDEHVLEDGDAVHLLEAAGERVVEARPGQRRHRLAADEGEAGRARGNGEGEGVGVVARGHPAEGNHRHLLRDGGHGAQHLRAAHDDAVGRLPHATQVQEGILLLGGGLGAVDLRIDEHVGEKEVSLAYVLVVAGGVLAEAGSRAGEPAGHEMPTRDELVHEVGGPAHEAEVVVRAQLEVLALLHQLLARVRDQERGGHGLPGGGRRVRHHLAVGRIELHVVLLRDGADRLLEDGLGGDVDEAAALQVDVRRAFLQGLHVFLATAGWHVGYVLSRALVTPRGMGAAC